MSLGIADIVSLAPSPYASSATSGPPFYEESVDLWESVSLSAVSGSFVAPIIPGDPFGSGLVENTFLHDVYYRIWVVPEELRIRNVRVGVNVPFYIWNAYPLPNTLESISAAGNTGVSMLITVPNDFYEIEYRRVDLRLTPEAPLTVDATYDFDFELGSGRLHFVVDYRLPILSVPPETPVKETWTWLTNTLVSADGSEQRIGLRSSPRRKLETRTVLTRHEDILITQAQLANSFSGEVLVPYYQYAATILENAEEGDTALIIDTARTDMRSGEYVYIYTLDRQEEVALVASLTASSVSLTVPLSIDIQAGSVVVPCAVAVVDGRPVLRRKSVNNAAEINITTTSAYQRASMSRPGSEAVLTLYEGMPVLDRVPLANEDVEHEFDAGEERFDYLTGVIDAITWWDYAKDSGQRMFVIHRVTDPGEFDWWRDFLQSINGARQPFLVPTYRDDYVLAGPVPVASNTITLVGTDYALSYWGKEAYNRFWLVTAAGSTARTVESINITADGDTDIVFTESLPADVNWTNIQHVYMLVKSRLGSDQVTATHQALDTFLSLTIRTVNQ